MELSVIVKGNRHQAAIAAANRGIPFVFVRETSDPWTIGRVGVQHEHKVQRWFCELDAAPFRVGTCLLYSTISDLLDGGN